MGIFNQLQSVVEWPDKMEGILLWKWQSSEIKKDSRLIIRPGQDAVFLSNGRIEGIFTDEGSYDIESEIIPFLTTLKSFKFGFRTPLRAEVVFVNTTEQTLKWGTKNPVNIPAQGLPGGMPIRCFGTFACKVDDVTTLIDKIAGVQQIFTVDDVKERMVSMLDQLLMSSIAREGHDMFNLQADARNIAKNMQDELDMEIRKLGVAVTDFRIDNFNYPDSVRKMQEKAAGQSMVGDVDKYTKIAAADGMSGGGGGNVAGAAVEMAVGMQMAKEILGEGAAAKDGGGAPAEGGIPKFCPNCGKPTNGMKFCGNCGFKLG